MGGWLWSLPDDLRLRVGLLAVCDRTTGLEQLDAVLDFSDSMIFAMALANVLGLYLLAPVVKRELESYWGRLRDQGVNTPEQPSG